MNERDIFLAALEKPTAEARSEYLSLACAGDPTLQQRVEGLLQMHEKTGEFLQKPLVERLLDGVAALEDAADTARDPSAFLKRSVELAFLSPSDQPSSLGRLGHYEVQEVIGRGGMGIVLRAFDERLHRVVAIKVMAAPLAMNAAGRKRFQREARAAAAVCHDHIVTIHAVEESDEVPYLVMQCVSGLSLQQRIDRDGPLELHEILRIGMQTASGLAAAHAQGLIHRDIKPANILLENGVERVKITDFGLARAAADASISQSGAVIGTPQYMAPEQARGEALDGRTDLFSLGSVLYAMCTGRAPFRATSSIAVLKRVCEEAPSPIREANADIPDWLVAIIDKLQAKNPDDRYQSAAEVAQVLGQRLAQLQNSTALPPAVLLASGGRKSPDSSVPAGGFLARKRRWAFAAAAVLVLAASFGLAEGTGATKLTATVIRLLTPDGTLVVEVTDPGVKVTIDGDGGLVITGAGLHEVHLKPGSHRIQADKNGQKVPLESELVSIAKGDRTVVRVKLETPAAPAVAIGSKDAFVLLAAGKERRFSTLAEAVLTASDGDTIEIRGNGPFVMPPIVIHQSLAIRAGRGFWPVIRFQPGAPGDDYLITAHGPLVLEGLEIREVSAKRTQPALVGRSLICSHAKSLHVANCRLEQEEPIHEGISLIMHHSTTVLRNCQFRNAYSHYVSFGNDAPVRFVMDNCLGVGGGAVYLHYAHVSHEARLEFRRNTLLTYLGAELGFSVAPDPALDTAEEKRIQYDASGNVFDSRLGMFQIDSLVANLNWQEAGDAETMFAPLIGWRDQRNVYSPSATAIHWSPRQSVSFPLAAAGLRAWERRWGQSNSGSIEGPVRLKGGDLLVKSAAAPERITPDDFRLRADSAGYRAGPDGKDFGADVDLVGPGPAYERWKKTPEYEEWLKETGQKK